MASGGSSPDGGGRGGDGIRVEVAAEVVATMAVVLLSPLTLYRPSATVLIHFVLRFISLENRKT